jgi:hypothetical protein
MIETSRLRPLQNGKFRLDAFRRFIFESTFPDRFEIGDDVQRRARSDDVELLRLAGRWLKFSLFGETSLQIKDRFRVGADAR